MFRGTGGVRGWPEAGCPCASCGRLPAGHRRPLEIVVDGVLRLPPTGPPPPGYRAQDTPHGLEITGPGGDRLLYTLPPFCALPPFATTSDTVSPDTGEGPSPEHAEDGPHHVVDGAHHAGGGVHHVVDRPRDAGRGVHHPGGGPYDVVLVGMRPETLGTLRRDGLAGAGTRVVAVGFGHTLPSEAEAARRLALWGVQGATDGMTLTAGTPQQFAERLPSTKNIEAPGTENLKTAERLPYTDSAKAAEWPSHEAGHLSGAEGSEVAERLNVEGAEEAERLRHAEVGWGPGGKGRVLVVGGSRSGKSAEAELRLAAEPYVTYVATGPSGGDDPDWRERVRLHRERRPRHWDTVETTGLAALLDTATGPLLIDGIGTWLAAVFDECGAWEASGDAAPEASGDAAREAGSGGAREAGGDGTRGVAAVAGRCDELVAAWRRCRVRLVAVSDEVGLGVVPATRSGRLFRDALGRLNQRLAAESEDAVLVVAGRVIPLPV
ncbi:hypothetical protein Misp01_56980 [Microtetraspora sp. NBRC 13810]|nr:hypothetical protein Misp01_56980 [Microtetraspora sp. NBRC 13810]